MVSISCPIDDTIPDMQCYFDNIPIIHGMNMNRLVFPGIELDDNSLIFVYRWHDKMF